MQQNNATQSGNLKTPKTPKDEKMTERALHALEQYVAVLLVCVMA